MAPEPLNAPSRSACGSPPPPSGSKQNRLLQQIRKFTRFTERGCGRTERAQGPETRRRKGTSPWEVSTQCSRRTLWHRCA